MGGWVGGCFGSGQRPNHETRGLGPKKVFGRLLTPGVTRLPSIGGRDGIPTLRLEGFEVPSRYGGAKSGLGSDTEGRTPRRMSGSTDDQGQRVYPKLGDFNTV